MVDRKERRAIYPGSFDPPTNGHKWMMEKMAEEFDHGFVAIGVNPGKPLGRFSLLDRMQMLEEIIAQEYPNLAVSSFFGLFQADFAEMMGAKYIVRGVRNGSDFAFENDIRHINETINPNVETVILTPPKELLQVSSSLVMGLVGFEGWQEEVALMVPGPTLDRLKQMQSEKDKDYLAKKWEELVKRLGVHNETKPVFEDLFQRYSKSNRAYHGISHLKTCLNELSLFKDFKKMAVENVNVVELALWFHDAVYETNKNGASVANDEEASAQLAFDVIANQWKLPRDFADEVFTIILATKHTGAIVRSNAEIVIDIDLAIFGRSTRLYDIYEKQIREEYFWVPPDVFAKKRSEILQSFLPPNRLNVYYLDFFRSRYEAKAQENLKRAIISLQNSFKS